MTDAAAPVLYSFRRCPFAMRARLALALSGTRCELREVRLRDKPPSLLEASPKGTVPVLVLPDGSVLEESLDIMRWALERNDPETWLAREDTGLIATCDGPFKRALDRYKYAERDGTDALAYRADGVAFLEVLDSRLAEQGQLSGPTRGFTDAAILPFVRQFVAVDRGWFDTLPLAPLRNWLDHHLASDLFGAIMLRVEPWVPGEPTVWFAP
ncbi:glutathione S-transferase [Qipengyuania sp. SM2507]